MSGHLIPTVDADTKLFPQATMDALAGALPGASDEQIASAVDDYLTANPPTAGEPLLAEHIVAELPHPAYDDIPSLTVLFENGLV
jgi:hypothetical protein